MKKIVLFSGFSGAGKGTILQELLKEIPNAKKLPNCTTRAKRKDDYGDKKYYSVKQFEKMIKNNELIEYDFHFDNYYGTRKKDLKDLLKKDKIVLLELDVHGAMNFKKQYGETLLVFVLPPSIKILKERLIKRGKITNKQFDIRITRMQKELSFIHNYDFVLVNNDLKKVVKEAKKIILK